jgi:hypothetical protein
MNRRQFVLCVIALVMIAGTALLLAAVPQKLGRPGIKAAAIPGSQRMAIYLPEKVLDFASSNREPDAGSLGMLPKDTSIAERVYYQRGMVPFVSSVVMMGTDRTSIHKAEYCLQGQGMRIDQITRETIPMTQPQPYGLPVVKIVGSASQSVNGKTVHRSCVYVYWYVTDGVLSNDRSGMERMWDMTKKLVFTGVLQRWAYVRFYAFCEPGQEDATYDVIKRMITASVPQFQTTPGPASAAMAAQ